MAMTDLDIDALIAEAAKGDPRLLAEISQLVADIEYGVRVNKIVTYRPYVWQADFHDAGARKQERMLMAANRVGKTKSAAAEVSYHLTGDYPDWWTGRRFEHPVLVWTGSPTNETSRDIVQTELLGGLGEKLGTGSVPMAKIVGKPSKRQAGVQDVVDSFQVRHASGGLSTCTLKSYDQGWQKFQGTAPHVVWLDEEPNDYMVFSECQTRILTSHGILMVTFTPLLGQTELVMHFQDGGDGIYIKNATWDDAPHLSEEDKARAFASMRPHEREARTMGIPMQGEGAVFPVSDQSIRVDPFEIPGHWARIKGADFGMDHPAAGVHLAWDRDEDCLYVIACYKKEGEKAPYHAAWFKKGAHATIIPVAWPHDGLNREKSGGEQIAEAYRKNGVNMLPKSARYPKVPGQDEKGGAQPVEPIVDEVLERMVTGRLKVFSTCTEFFEEKRGYHRKDGKIVDRRDDILKAAFYAVMMKRYAVAPGSFGVRKSRAPQRPTSSMRLQ
jgi:phage terminase large subunit-like protein